MKVSVVTVVYNNPQVGEALDSILSQRLPPGDEVELVVIDGGSTDGTREVLERYRSQISVLVSEPDCGLYDAMNKGLARATGDVVGTLNSDDFYEGDQALGDVLSAFRAPGVDAVYGDLVYVRPDRPGEIVRYWRSGPFRPGSFRRGWMPPHPTFFVRREVYQQHGVFDLRFRIAADVELLMRFLEVYSIQSVHLPRVLVRMRTGGASNRSLRNRWRATRECFQVLRMHGQGPPLFYLPRKVVNRLSQFFRRPRQTAQSSR